MASELQPEFFSLLGINIFLALSLLTCLFEKNFPTAIPYVYQSAALFGFGQLWISKEFSQIYINEGLYEQQVGNWYDLAASATDYIAVTVQANSTGASFIYVYLEILEPNTSIYIRYILTFVIT